METKRNKEKQRTTKKWKHRGTKKNKEKQRHGNKDKQRKTKKLVQGLRFRV